MSFQFKQFKIEQQKCAFKVGTDSVLLGSWVNPQDSSSILDIGTGSGILALMMAQKSKANICAIDIDQGAFEQATENVKNSPWPNQVEVIHTSLQNFILHNEKKFQVIITNPPYFNNQQHAKNTSISVARNTQLLTYLELIQGAQALLESGGKFCVVLPTEEAKLFIKIAQNQNLVLSKLLRVHTKPGSEFEKRQLMEFQKTAFQYIEETLVIEEEEHFQFTAEYRNLTRDFYLDF